MLAGEGRWPFLSSLDGAFRLAHVFRVCLAHLSLLIMSFPRLGASHHAIIVLRPRLDSERHAPTDGRF
jgi:hypothetical protein